MLLRFTRLLLPLLAFTLLGHASAAAAEPQELKDYVMLDSPQPTGNPKKIVVEEFFWYGCPHCFHAEPDVQAWRRTLPKDVVFKREAPALNENWQSLAKAHYAMETLKLSDRLGLKLFKAIHEKQELNVTDQSALIDWMAKQGVDRKKFADVYNSFGVDNAIGQANQRSLAYHIDGVPTFVVNGKYLTSMSMAGNGKNLVATINYLVARERKNKH